MIPLRLALGIATLSVAASPGALLSQEHHTDTETTEEAFHKSHLSLFTGGTTESNDGSTSTAFSLRSRLRAPLEPLGGTWTRR
jgi:hypothetical protein